MADKNVSFFNPLDVLTMVSVGWVQQENGLVEAFQRAQGLKANGDEAAKKLWGGMESGSVVYECFSESGNLSLVSAGSVRGGYHIDNFQLVYQPTGWPRLTFNVHQHDTNPHGTSNLPATFAPGVTCPARWGIPRSFGGIVITAADCGIKALTYDVSCTHQDEDENGAHLAGGNRDGIERVTMEFTGVPTWTATGWDEMSEGSPRGNTAAQGYALTFERHIQRSS